MDELEDGFTCYWRIENFDICEKSRDTELTSQYFEVPLLFNNEQKSSFSLWRLTLLHRSFKLVGLFLHKDGTDDAPYFRLKLSILTTEGWMLCAKGVCKDLKQSTFVRGTPQLIKWNKHNPVQKFLLNGCLTVSCHMSNFSTKNKYEQCVMTSKNISGKLVHTSLLQFSSLKPCDLLNFSVPKYSGPCPSCTAKEESITASVQTESTDDSNKFKDSKNLLKALTEESVQYVFLRTASTDFAVSKALLCASSPVFNDMLQWKRCINDNNIVNVDDVDDDSLSLLLQFLHLEPIEDLGLDAATKLFRVAEKYQIASLMTKCRSFLKRKRSNKKYKKTI